MRIYCCGINLIFVKLITFGGMVSGARQGNPTVQCCIAMATQFTAREHLNDPGHLSEECLQVHDLRASLCGAVLGTFT